MRTHTEEKKHINAPCVKKTFLLKNSLDKHILKATIWITPGRDNVLNISTLYCKFENLLLI